MKKKRMKLANKNMSDSMRIVYIVVDAPITYFLGLAFLDYAFKILDKPNDHHYHTRSMLSRSRVQ